MELDQVSEVYRAYKSAEVSPLIHPDDLMHQTGAEHYVSVGLSAMHIILRGLALSWLPAVSSILDLPCGHGRVARHLRAAFPYARMVFCDVDKSGVAFCAETFKGQGVYSKPDLTQVELPMVDLIWVGSLFTHVDLMRTTTWLRFLARHLSENGVLIATFHGLFFKEMVKSEPLTGGVDWPSVLSQYQEIGYGYVPYTDFEMGDYGVSLSKASLIMDIATAIPGTRVLGYTERGWSDNHDVLILGKTDRFLSFDSSGVSRRAR